MKKFSKHTPEQIVAKLERAAKLKAEGKTVADICRDIGVSEPTLARWRRDYADMNRSQARELRKLREENDRLKRLLRKAQLEKEALKLVAEGKF